MGSFNDYYEKWKKQKNDVNNEDTVERTSFADYYTEWKKNQQEQNKLEPNRTSVFSDRKNKMKEIGNSNEKTIDYIPIKSESNNEINTPTEFIQKAIPFVKDQIGDNIGYIAKNLGSGVVSGLTGQAQGVLLDSANQMEKGQNKDSLELGTNAINGLMGIINPAYAFTNIIKNYPQQAKNMIETISDKDKNALEKLATISSEASSNALNSIPAKQLINANNQLVGKIAPYSKDVVLKANEKIAEPANKMNQELAEEGEKYSTPVKYLGSGAQAIGNMVPSMVATAITKNPNVGMGAMMLGAKGQATQEALNKGADLDTANKIGDTKALIELGTESLTGGLNFLGKGKFDDVINGFIDNKVKSKLANFLIKKGLDIPEEQAEEVVSDILGFAIDKGTIDLNAEYTLDDLKNTLITTGISTFGLNALNGSYSKSAYNQNTLGMKTNEVQNKIKEAPDTIDNSQQNQPVNESNTQVQQITNQDNKVAENELSKEIKIDSEKFAKQVDNVQNIKENNDLIVLSKTPQVYLDLGADNLPMTVTKNHTIWAMTPKDKNNSHFHGISKETLKQLPEAMTRPLNIIQSGSDTNSIVAITELVDDDGALIIVPIKIRKGKSNVNEILIDANVFKSIYGKDHDYDNWMKGNIEKGRVLYDIDEGIIKKYRDSTPRLQLPNVTTSTDETSSFINNIVPFSQENVNTTNKSMQNNENNTQKTQGENINWNEIQRPNGKFRKHYQSIIESSNTTAEAKAIAKEMMGTDTYIPESNKSQIERADKYIENNGVEKALERLREHIENDEISYDSKGLLGTLTRKKVSVDDIALGERLIQYFSKTGESENLQDAIHYTAIMGTEAGRAVQIMSLLNHMTPQGQVVWLQRSIEKVNNELQQKYKNRKNIPQFELTEDMINKVLETDSQEDMYKVLDEVYKELGQQVPKSFIEKIDEWRYFSMLANVKTHARNMIGNVAMGGVQKVKNKVAGAIEGTVAKFNPDMERTHTIKRASKKTKEFAKNDVKNIDVQTQMGMNENKYNPQSRLQNARRTFKSDILEKTLGKIFNLNSTALEVEDNIGLKSMYVNALSEYITANNIDVNNITDEQLAKARQHAIKEAQEATFHQASALATALNQMGRKNNLTKFALDAAVPFKKTPINVAKTGIQYSPVGLIKSAVYDIPKLRKGTITVNQYIDNISKGLTGTGITFLGYALAQAGILKASGGDDDKKEKYDEEQGKQTYSIEIAGKTASLDWLSPVGIPLFIGAEINQQFNNSKKEKTSKSTDDEELLNQAIRKVGDMGTAFSNAMNPMSEMSMLSGLTSVLSSYNKENALGNMFVNAGKSYVNQFFPTVMSQLARTTDDYERTTTSTSNGTLPKAIDSTINQVKSKIPGLRQTLPIKTDIWGKEVKQSENLPFRAFNNFVNPSIIKDVSIDDVDKELNDLYAKTKESSIIPKSIEKTFSIDGQDYRYTDEEYAKYNKKYGETSYNLIKNLIKSSEYKKLSNEQKQTAIDNIYKYAKEEVKVDYAKNNNIDYETTNMYNVASQLSDNNRNQYFEYTAKIKDMEKQKEKIQALADASYSNNVKKTIYENSLGKEDSLYGVMKNTGIDMTEYLKYKTQEFESDKEDDGTVNGKAISGSKKDKVYDYVRNMNISNKQKLLLMGTQYTLSNSEQTALAQYVNSLKITKKEKLDIFSKLKGFTVYKDGKVKW